MKWDNHSHRVSHQVLQSSPTSEPSSATIIPDERAKRLDIQKAKASPDAE